MSLPSSGLKNKAKNLHEAGRQQKQAKQVKEETNMKQVVSRMQAT
jgi:hypothetical protein